MDNFSVYLEPNHITKRLVPLGEEKFEIVGLWQCELKINDDKTSTSIENTFYVFSVKFHKRLFFGPLFRQGLYSLVTSPFHFVVESQIFDRVVGDQPGQFRISQLAEILPLDPLCRASTANHALL